ncbi:MAG: DUF4445 domain-containing protein [Clostridia bacterium]|nr:DUF4445 domain-containing protein [Clostridia bacterium]
MNRFSEKVYLEMTPPSEQDPRSDQHRLTDALSALGYPLQKLPLKTLRRLHPACIAGGYRITVTLVFSEEGWIAAAVEPSDTRASHYALAVDYGSTTIIMQLVDVNSGSVIAQVSRPNGQRAFGDDILTRITHTLEDASKMDALQAATVETFHHLLGEITEQTGIDASALPAMILSGNTTMIHFLLGLDAWTVFASPYAPVTMNPGWLWGSEIGMDFAGVIYIIPAASNYVGGDIVSGLLTMDFYKKDGLGVFFDIGTNGELVMGNRHWLLAGAGAAGPALEGYISRYGVRAQPGAVDKVAIDGSALRFTTIENRKPIGICGSGIIDLIAQMRLNGWINIAGELNPEASDRVVWIEDEQQYAAVYADERESASGERLYFSQTDIKQYLETKAAAHTMVDCLLEAAGADETDIDHFYLSGAFTAHSDLESAITVGIFPDLPREKYTSLANSSLDGARTLLLDRTRFDDIRYLTENMYCVQFASIPDFIIRMYAAKFIPHTDMNLYPTVGARLKEKGL